MERAKYYSQADVTKKFKVSVKKYKELIVQHQLIIYKPEKAPETNKIQSLYIQKTEVDALGLPLRKKTSMTRKEYKREYNKKYYKKNIEKIKTKTKEYKELHKDRFIEYNKEYNRKSYEKNKAKKLVQMKEYRERNREKLNTDQRERNYQKKLKNNS